MQLAADISKQLNKNFEEEKMSAVTYHISPHQQPEPETLPLLTPPLCTEGWFTKTQIFTELAPLLIQSIIHNVHSLLVPSVGKRILID